MSSSALSKRYGAVADAYDAVWAPPLVAFAAPLLAALDIQPGEQVADLGAGTGAIARGLGALCFDRTHPMLARAAAKGLPAAVCDIRTLPVRDGSFDAALSTFVLQHVPTAGLVARETHRILRVGGRFGTATWSEDHGESGGVYDIVADVFRDIPDEQVPMKTWHDRVDAPGKLRRFMKRARFSTVNAWVEHVHYDWPREDFFTWATTMGPYGRRLAALDDATREQVARALRMRLDAADARDLRWSPTIVYCVGIK